GVGTSAVRVDVGLAKRPAAGRHEGAGFKVDRIERCATATPGGARSAQLTSAIILERPMQGQIADLSPVQVVGPSLQIIPSALQNDNVLARTGEFQGEDDACRASADDANLRADDLITAQVSAVDDHVPPHSSAAKCERSSSTRFSQHSWRIDSLRTCFGP